MKNTDFVLDFNKIYAIVYLPLSEGNSYENTANQNSFTQLTFLSVYLNAFITF